MELPPAKIFMGDVGSGYLGSTIAVLALASSWHNSVYIYVWLILGGIFFVDATVTLLRRIARGERVYVAHRSHAYQALARRLGSHRKVTLIVWVINLLWLFPMSYACLKNSGYELVILCVALTPLLVLTLYAGAGRTELDIRTQ